MAVVVSMVVVLVRLEGSRSFRGKEKGRRNFPTALGLPYSH
jgi:hypothetical protein